MIKYKLGVMFVCVVLIFISCARVTEKSERHGESFSSDIQSKVESNSQPSLQDIEDKAPVQILGQNFREFKDLIQNCTLLNDDRYSIANMVWLDNENILVLQTKEEAAYRLVIYNCIFSTEIVIYSEEDNGSYEMETFDDGKQFIIYLRKTVLIISKEDFQVLDVQKKAVPQQTSAPSKDGKVIYRDRFTVYMSNFTDASTAAKVVTGQNGEIFDPPSFHSPWSFDGSYVMLIHADAWDDVPPYWKYLIVDTENGFAAKSYEYKGVRATDEMWSKLNDSFYVIVQNEEKQNTLETVNIADGNITRMPLGEGNIQILGEVDGGKKLLLLCDREGQWNIDLFSKADSTQKKLFYCDYWGLNLKLNPDGSRILLFHNSDGSKILLSPNNDVNTVIRVIDLS